MADMQDGRTDLARSVYHQLSDPRFRQRLTARDADGEPIVTLAMPTDKALAIMTRVSKLGGRTNVIMPFLNGIAVVTMTVDVSDAEPEHAEGPRLDNDCTMGLLLARMAGDGPASAYHFIGAVDGQDERASAEAELVSLS